MNLDLYFPTPIWWEDTEINNDEIYNLVLKLKSEDPIGRKLSNQGGWQSKDFRPGEYKELRELENKITLQTEQCYRDFGYAPGISFIAIENLWININGKNNTNSVHTHDGSFISGAYYVKAGSQNGNINFYKNYHEDYIISSQAPLEKFTQLSASAITFMPLTKRLIMFPGWLPHGVERNEINEDRISISFNTKIIRNDDDRYRIASIK